MDRIKKSNNFLNQINYLLKIQELAVNFFEFARIGANTYRVNVITQHTNTYVCKLMGKYLLSVFIDFPARYTLLE